MAELLREAIRPTTIIELAERIQAAYPAFDTDNFTDAIVPHLADLTLSERLALVTETLTQYLPQDFTQAATILIDSLGDELDSEADDPTAKEYESNRGFIVVALGNFIAAHGLDHFDVSMHALYEMTKRFSSEGPIRDFIIHDEARTLALYAEWVNDPNVHVRRLVSESTRPRLPWARQLKGFIENPRPVIELLAQLKNDSRLYVRRSVANNLNDIAKDHPDVVVETLRDWQDDSPHMAWLTKHALRTLIKAGHPDALDLLGFSQNVEVVVEAFHLEQEILVLGESLRLQVQLSTESAKLQNLMIDYVVYHMKANGTLKPKVFKWTQKQLTQGEPLILQKGHAIKPISTRKYYAGQHEVHLQINGKIVAEATFELVIEDDALQTN